MAHLGNLEPVLRDHGYRVQYIDAATDPFDAVPADLVVVLGGDMGVYERAEHPFLVDELAFLRARLRAAKPTFGICLGAQLMAAALGSRVYQGPTVEIGFRRLMPTADGIDSPLRHFVGVPVMQWHGDTFDLPHGSTRLASSEQYPTEAFRLGRFALAVQFHAELEYDMYDEWIEDGAAELERLGIPHELIRSERDRYADAATAASQAMLADWLRHL